MNAKPARSDAYVSNVVQYFGTHARFSIFELTTSLGARPDSLQCNNCLVSHASCLLHLFLILTRSGIDVIPYRDGTRHAISAIRSEN
jgi:hypothetical protein